MSGLDTQTHKHTHTQSDYRNPRCACAPRVNNGHAMVMQWKCYYSTSITISYTAKASSSPRKTFPLSSSPTKYFEPLWLSRASLSISIPTTTTYKSYQAVLLCDRYWVVITWKHMVRGPMQHSLYELQVIRGHCGSLCLRGRQAIGEAWRACV